MNSRDDPELARARRIYLWLTLAYPRQFRKDYGTLLLQLFCDQFRAARAEPESGALVRFWLRILGDLASSVLREQLDRIRSLVMNQERAGAVILGMLLFVVLGVGIGLSEAPVVPKNYSLLNMIGMGLWFFGYFVVLGLLLKGWLAGFPRWVYPNLSYGVIFPLYLSSASTPGLSLFGIPIWGRELWGWRAFVPLGLIILAGLIFSRQRLTNLAGLVRNIWEDWTLAVFSLFGLMPFSVFFTLDEVDNSFAFWPELAGILLIVLGAFFYMRLARSWLRCLALLVCAFSAMAIMAGSSSYFWGTHYVNFSTGESYILTTQIDWNEVLSSAISEAGFVTLFLLLPLPMALARLVYDWLHPQKTSPS